MQLQDAAALRLQLACFARQVFQMSNIRTVASNLQTCSSHACIIDTPHSQQKLMRMQPSSQIHIVCTLIDLLQLAV